MAAENVEMLIGVRGLAKDLIAGAESKSTANAVFAENSDAAGELLVEMVRKGDAVLVKGSRGVRTEKVIDKLLEKFELED